tara:strand:- start:15720 stop:16379 length:660 start_codon:yes stop_codon:yes gene_type:complete
MAKKVKKVSKIKTKKKIWYKVIAPKLFGHKEIGESYLTTPEIALNRKLKVNLKELSGNVKDQNIHMKFKISKIDGSNLQTDIIGYQLAPSFTKRMVRKNTDCLKDQFSFKTKDNKAVILKSIVVTRNKTQRSVRTAIRAKIEKMFKEEISTMDFASFVQKLVTYKVQGSFKKKLSKIYPIKEVAVRMLILQDKKRKASVEETVEQETPEPAAEETPSEE